MQPTVIIPFYNGHTYLGRLLASIPDFLRVMIVDDQSDPLLTMADVTASADLSPRRLRNLSILTPSGKGYFAGAVNEGFIRSAERWGGNDYLVLNQDTYFTGDGWLDKLRALPREVAIAGDGVFDHPAWPNGYVQGTFMFIRREAFHEVGLLNRRDYPLWGCTAEWQLRAARRGWQAAPWREVPDFVHTREGGAGSSIRETLTREPARQGLLIRTPPMVSVIIPCFNHGQYLPAAVQSILDQSFQATEIIIVDDASTDGSGEIADSLANAWTGVKVIRRKTNGGTPAANNTGIEAARGKFVTILCADDMRERGSLERLYRALEKRPHAIAYDDVMLQFETRQHVWQMKEYDFDSLLQQNFIHAGIMFPRLAWEEVGGYPEKMLHGREDWAMNVALGRAGYCGIRIPEPGYIYRRHKQNRTLTNTTDEWKSFFRSQMEELYPDLYTGRKEDRPMGCCGNRDPLPSGAVRAAGLTGENGMTLLEYQGGNWGEETYYGPVTGARYSFSASARVRNVAIEDAPGMLELYDNGNAVFAPVQVSAPVASTEPEVHSVAAEAAPVKTSSRRKKAA